LEETIAEYREALVINPGFARQQDDRTVAAREFREFIRLAPSSSDSRERIERARTKHFGRHGKALIRVTSSCRNDILCIMDSTTRLSFFVICSVFFCHKSGDANTKIPNSNTAETEHGMQRFECCDDRGQKDSGGDLYASP
jgi:hypothetical protein